MQTTKHYSKAPITEAIIDFKVSFPEGFSVDNLANIHTLISDKFPSKEPIYTGSFVFQPSQTPVIDANHQQSGFIFKSTDGLRILQATLNAFTFSRLAPYETWEDFRDEAKHLWKIYNNTCKPLNITRAAIRYVNRLDLPSPSLDFKDYLRTVPEVAPDLEQGLSAYFMQLQIPQTDLNCMLIINQGLVPPASPNVVSVLLDFDLFREQIWQSDDEDIWNFLEALRYRKNLAFEASITENTRRLIN